MLTQSTTWKVSKYGVISGPCFSVFGLNTGKYEPEVTPYLDTFTQWMDAITWPWNHNFWFQNHEIILHQRITWRKEKKKNSKNKVKKYRPKWLFQSPKNRSTRPEASSRQGVHKSFKTFTKKQKASVLESLFIKVAGMKACNVIQKRLRYSFFSLQILQIC